MSSGEKDNRINKKINMPSVGLKNFIEKALQDDKFFEAAIESPLQFMKANGVNLNVETLTPKDLAAFFGALSGIKDLIKNKQIKDIRFENIFGESAELHGTNLMAEKDRGMYTQFKRDAVAEKEICFSGKEEFDFKIAKPVSMTKAGSAFEPEDKNQLSIQHLEIGGKAGILDDRTIIESLFNGPLIEPADLISIAAQINAYVNDAEQI